MCEEKIHWSLHLSARLTVFSPLCPPLPPCQMYVTNSIACWHTERRTTGTGKNRRTKTVTVYTYRATEQFNYEYCMDRTPAGIHCGDFSVVRVDTRVEYEWGNHETRQAFEAVRLSRGGLGWSEATAYRVLKPFNFSLLNIAF